jgi:hypothetical protein
MTSGRSWRLQEARVKKKGIDPVWRGIGCFMFLILTVGSYFVADAALNAINDANRVNRFLPAPFQGGIPRYNLNFYTYEFPRAVTEIGPLKLDRPIKTVPLRLEFISLAATLFISIVGFGLMVLIWGMLNPPKLGPKDAPPVRRKIDPRKVR